MKFAKLLKFAVAINLVAYCIVVSIDPTKMPEMGLIMVIMMQSAMYFSQD